MSVPLAAPLRFTESFVGQNCILPTRLKGSPVEERVSVSENRSKRRNRRNPYGFLYEGRVRRKRENRIPSICSCESGGQPEFASYLFSSSRS